MSESESESEPFLKANRDGRLTPEQVKWVHASVPFLRKVVVGYLLLYWRFRCSSVPSFSAWGTLEQKALRLANHQVNAYFLPRSKLLINIEPARSGARRRA